MKWIVGSSNHSCWLGIYELEKQVVIKSLVKPGMTVFDIGANAGFYTLAFSRLVGNRGQVWAFEPLAENANNLLQHIRLNLLNNVTLIQAVVVNRNGIVGFKNSKYNVTGAVSEEQPYKVPAVFLDELVKNKVIPVPDVIKMDVEGAESLVLEGAKSLLKQKRTTLFIALHGEQEKSRCRKILESYGYKIFLLDGTALDSILWGNEIYEIYAVPE